MGFFHRLIHRKKIKQRDEEEQLRSRYDNVRKQIDECKATMTRCIMESLDLDKSSMAYQNNERTYNAERHKLTLLKKQKERLDELMKDADPILDVSTIGPRDWEPARFPDRIKWFDKSEDDAEPEMQENEFAVLIAAKEARELRTASANGTAAEPETQESECDARVAAASEE